MLQFSALETMGLLDLNDLDTSLSNLYNSKALGAGPATQDFSDDDETADDSNTSEEAKAAAAQLAATCAANTALAAKAAASANGSLKRPPPVVTKPVTAASSGTGTASGRNMSPLAVMTSRGSQGFGDSDEQNDNGTSTTVTAADTVYTYIPFIT
jgi:hypothetical protein